MNSVERAAAFLIAVGKEAAAEILRNLDEETVVRLTMEMGKIESLSPDDKEEIIGEFMVSFNKIKDSSFGGEEFARKILVDSLGENRAREITDKIKTASPEVSFDFLNNVDAETIAGLLAGEHPQTIAVLFSHLDSQKCGTILGLLDREQAKEVALRLAKMQKVSPEAVARVAEVLYKRYQAISASALHNANNPGGVDKVADILNYLDPQTENSIMKHFEMTLPETAHQISEKVYTFENIISLANIEVRILIDELGDDDILSLALKGAGDEVRFKVLRNVSNNRATDIINDMERMGPVRMSEILEARREIVQIMRRLDHQGKIVIKKKREEYVE